MKNEKLIHDWMVSHLKNRLSRNYDEIKANIGEEKKNEFNGHYPDLILINQGLVMAIMEVETESGISSGNAEKWKTVSGLGAKLILMVPRALKAKTIDLLWKQGLADKASVGSYDINISMP